MENKKGRPRKITDREKLELFLKLSEGFKAYPNHTIADERVFVWNRRGHLIRIVPLTEKFKKSLEDEKKVLDKEGKV